MHLWKRLRRIGTDSNADLTQAAEMTSQSKRQAREDLERQKTLLQHENKTVTEPLRHERTKVNHLAVLAQQALRGN